MKSGVLIMLAILLFSCKKNESNSTTEIIPELIVAKSSINGIDVRPETKGISLKPAIKISFNNAVKTTTAANAISLSGPGAVSTAFNISFTNHDSGIIIKPTDSLNALSSYTLMLSTSLKSSQEGLLNTAFSLTFNTGIDSTNKFPTITDSALLTKVQEQTFQIFLGFWPPGFRVWQGNGIHREI